MVLFSAEAKGLEVSAYSKVRPFREGLASASFPEKFLRYFY